MTTSGNEAYLRSPRGVRGEREEALRENAMDRQPYDPLVQYEIRLRGTLPPDWSHWFDNMTMTNDREGNTVLSGPIVDQAALHSLFDKARDLGLALLEVRRVPPAGKG